MIIDNNREQLLEKYYRERSGLDQSIKNKQDRFNQVFSDLGGINRGCKPESSEFLKSVSIMLYFW